ncbi:MAG TPA: nodulation protein NfeD [Rudaea sp.]|nr:nodulation protein NfeD [Rudaea sp.]
MVAQIDLDGPIGPAAAEYFDQALAHAQADGAVAVVLRLDTPGGLSESMRQIISAILASPLPVLGYVGPQGARAASAGTYILYATQIAAMAPATHLGAATPVALGGSTPFPSPAGIDKPKTTPSADQKQTDNPSATPAAGKPETADERSNGDAESHKVLNDAIAYIRSLAQLRGRDAQWAEQAVRGAATLTADEALRDHVIDFIASDVTDLLRQADGRRVRVGSRDVELHVAGASVRSYKPDWRSGFLGIITNPTIAYLLLLAGIYGLVLEAFHPGAMLPGIAGGICLLIGLYALQLLPVNYAGLALMALGLSMLIAEVLTTTYGALGVGGIISFVLGSIMLFNTDVPGYSINMGVIGGLAFCAFALLALVLWLVLRSHRAHHFGGDQQLFDAVGKLLEPVDADGEAQALIVGEQWRVRSPMALPTGTRIRVTRRDGLLLWVKPE